MNVLFAMSLLLAAGGPAEELLERAGKLSDAAKPEEFREFVHPDGGMEVDTSAEGSRTPRWTRVTRENLGETFEAAVRPLIRQGLFKAPPQCSRQGSAFHCTLATAASLPRTCELSEMGGKWYMVRIRWAGGEEPGDGEDDDLPM